VLEEVLVVETRLLVTEEVRITRRRTETHMPERVTLRREDVTIERVDRERHEPHSQEQEERHGEDRDRTL
jgi:stress response protein YsnF